MPTPSLRSGSVSYSFEDKSSGEIVRDLEAGLPQGLVGAGAYERAAAALQAAVARENRRWAIGSFVVSVCALIVAIIALIH